MYEKAIRLLEQRGIQLTRGLNQAELDRIREGYGIEFPEPLKVFFQSVLPMSDAFYDWRDFSESNISFLKELMESPLKKIYDWAGEVYWCDDWGDEPEDEAKRVAFIRGKIPDAPRLIPIYSHRYMPLCSLENYPVLSVHGVDVIYYGGNLEEYFNIEFGDQKQSSLDIAHIEYVPFWSDLM